MIVKGEGDLNAKLWFIGEAPGAREEEVGRPFVGGAGTVFDGLLRKVGIVRSTTYIDNIIQQRPKNNDFGIFYTDSKRGNPTETLFQRHREVKELILKYRPNLIVLLGNEPLFAIFGHKGIQNWRGSILNFNGVKVIPTLHPALVMRDPSFSPIAEMDFHRIAEEAKTPALPSVYKDDFLINPTYETVIRYLTEILPQQEMIAFDIETIPDLEQIMCIGFGWSRENAICIPIFFGQGSWGSLEEEIGIKKADRNLMALKRI